MPAFTNGYGVRLTLAHYGLAQLKMPCGSFQRKNPQGLEASYSAGERAGGASKPCCRKGRIPVIRRASI